MDCRFERKRDQQIDKGKGRLNSYIAWYQDEGMVNVVTNVDRQNPYHPQTLLAWNPAQ